MAENQPNREQLLIMAINAAKSGQKDGARVMLRQVLSQDKQNERAMMWMAKLARSDKEKEQWLARAVQVNPQNDDAKTALQKMRYKTAAANNRTLLVVGGIVIVVIAIVAFVLILLSNAR
jgi:lipopolysaccharide biosynthesis regulator YciM